MIDFDDIEWVSFDCYGTLIDWETGISASVGEVTADRGIVRSRAEILALYAEFEPRAQDSESFLHYRSVLRRVMLSVGNELGFRCNESELDCLIESLPNWPVFPDVVDALQTLKKHYKLAVISNVDDDLFAGTAKRLGVDFDVVVTAEQVGSYKPDLTNFHAAAARMGVDRSKWLHVAESLYHDIAPANRLGVKSVWVNRAARGGGTRVVDAEPDLTVPDLAVLARMMSTA